MIHKLRTDRGSYEKAERALARQSASLQSMISRSRPSGTAIKVVSGFIKPIQGRITSPFGWRTHPIFNSKSFHSGVDIGGPNLGAIRASNSGKVIYSGTDDKAKVGNETIQVSAVATFDGDNYEVKFSFTNEDGTVTNVVSTPEPTTSSVSEINGATAAVAATEGAILVSNYNGAAAVYTTDGRLAANTEVNGSASINVAAGLYIVRTGNKATKVIVK